MTQKSGEYRRRWLRPKRIGCLLVVLVLPAAWLLGSAVNGVADLFRDHPAPVTGSPLDPVARARPASSGSPSIDRITQRGNLIVAVAQAPGRAQRSPDSGGYTGFDIALVGLIAQDLGVDPTRTSFKPLAASNREPALSRGDVDLLLGDEITPPGTATMGIAGPYLVHQGTTEYGIGLPPGDPVLHQRITAVLRRAIDDGTWARLYGEYLGTPIPNPPVPG
ncbi:MAG: transporter substrate-binding domain-containing protein [Pseudonocardiaceae bacterium]